MFLDRATIHVQAGDGGDGCLSFRREKFVPRGGPDGGDGGNGGSVTLRADAGRSTLLDFHYRQNFRAGRGEHGQGALCTGKAGADLLIPVPCGTVVFDDEDGRLLADLRQEGEDLLVAAGGRGGRGNARFTSSTNRAPRRTDPGGEGERRSLRLELRLIADIGLVGFPNVGKSTLLSRLTAARPRVADYPFTTLAPHLGVVELGGGRTAVMADVPGLIEGAHAGAGLGIRFLQHLRRTRILVHLVDAAALVGRDPLDDYTTVRGELAAYGAGLDERPELVVLSRVDLLQDEARLEPLAAALARSGRPAPLRLSAVTGAGIEDLRHALVRLLDTLPPDSGPADGSGDGEQLITLRERAR